MVIYLLLNINILEYSNRPLKLLWLFYKKYIGIKCKIEQIANSNK